MTAKELEQVVNSYIKEYSEYNIDPSVIFKDLYSQLYELRSEDIETYYMLDRMSYKDQADVLHRVLHDQYHPDEIDPNQDKDVLEEVFLSGAALTALSAGLGYILLLFLRKTKLSKSILNNFSEQVKRLAGYLVNASKGWRVRYQIIRKNTERCYKKCDVSPDTSSDSIYKGTRGSLNIDQGSLPLEKYTYDPNDLAKGECMTDCFIDTLYESIKLLYLNYLECLRQTGQISKYENLSKHEIEIAVSQLRVDGCCEEFRKQLNDAIKLYYDTIEYRYGKEDNYSQVLTDYRNKLADGLYALRHSKEKSSFDFKKIDQNMNRAGNNSRLFRR